METVTEIIVEEGAIDELNHVNNSIYVTYLEEARADWYEAANFSFDTMRENNLGTVVLRLDITFLNEAVLGDVLSIKTSPLRLGNTSFDHKQVIYNTQGEKITEAVITSVMFDREARKSIKVVEE